LEAIIVPMAVLERDESRAANAFGRRKTKEKMMMMIQSKVQNLKKNKPVMGLVQAVQRLAKSSPKHSAQ
jgi:hypothetical protein